MGNPPPVPHRASPNADVRASLTPTAAGEIIPWTAGPPVAVATSLFPAPVAHPLIGTEFTVSCGKPNKMMGGYGLGVLATVLLAAGINVVCAIPGNAVAGGSSHGVSFDWNRADTISMLGASLPINDMTVEYWYKDTNPNADYYTVHSYSAYNARGFQSNGGTPYESANELQLSVSPRHFRLWRGSMALDLTLALTDSMEWRHFAFTLKQETGEVALYIDGEMLDFGSASIEISNASVNDIGEEQKEEKKESTTISYKRLDFSNGWDVAESDDAAPYLGSTDVDVLVLRNACDSIASTATLEGKAVLIQKSSTCSAYEQAKNAANAAAWMIVFDDDAGAVEDDEDVRNDNFEILAPKTQQLGLPVISISSEEFVKVSNSQRLTLKRSKVAEKPGTPFADPVEPNGVLHLGLEPDKLWGDFDELQSANGILDEYRVWNIARTPQKIKEEYRLSIGPDHPEHKHLSVYWKFDDEPTVNDELRLITADSSFTGANGGIMGGLPTVQNEILYMTNRGSMPPTVPERIPTTSSPIIAAGSEHVVPYVSGRDIVLELKSYDPDGDDLTTIISTLPSVGSLHGLDEAGLAIRGVLFENDVVVDPSRTESKRVIFRPPPSSEKNATDDILFTYSVSDGGDPFEATIRLVPNKIFQPEDSTKTVEEDSLAYFALALPSQLSQDNMKVKITSLPGRGTIYQAKFSPESDPTWTSIAKSIDQYGEMDAIWDVGEFLTTDRGVVMYQPAKDEHSNGPDDIYASFSYRLVDPLSGIESGEATISIIVTAVNDAPVGISAQTNLSIGDHGIILLESVDVDSDTIESFAERTYAKISSFPLVGKLYQYDEKAEGYRGAYMDPAITEVPQTFAWASRVVRYSSQYSLCDRACYSWKNPECTSNDVLSGGKDDGKCSETAWHASQILGPPDAYPIYGDSKKAMAFSEEKYGHEFIELEYPFDIYLSSFELFETYKPGSLWKVSTADHYADDTEEPCFRESCTTHTKWATLWTKPQELVVAFAETSRIFSPPICPATHKSRLIRLDFDTKRVAGWNNFDAARVTGSLQSQPGLIVDASNRMIYEPLDGVHGSDSFFFTVSDCLGVGKPTEYSILLAAPPVGSFSPSSFATEFVYLSSAPGEVIKQSVDLTSNLIKIGAHMKVSDIFQANIWYTEAMGAEAGEKFENISLLSPNITMNLGTLSTKPSRLELWLQAQASYLTFRITLLPRIFVKCSNGRVDDDHGICVCTSQRWSGSDCSVEAVENRNEVPRWVKATGYTMFAIIFLLVSATAYLVRQYREKASVRAAQPAFCFLILCGIFICSISIILLQIEESDVACAMLPWFFFLGFSISFGAMFAKILRVYTVFKNGTKMIRKTVTVAETLRPVLAMLAANTIILVIWAALDPLLWTRTISQEDSYGYALESYGQCASENLLPYILPLSAINIMTMTIAVILSYKARHIPGKFQDGKYIGIAVLSCIEFFFIGIPVAMMVVNDPSIRSFIMSTVVFLANLSIFILIFGPIVYNIFFQEKDKQKGSKFKKFSSKDKEPNSVPVPGQLFKPQIQLRQGVNQSGGDKNIGEVSSHVGSKGGESEVEHIEEIQEARFEAVGNRICNSTEEEKTEEVGYDCI